MSFFKQKRRVPDDIVFDLQNVSLSPPKRVRVSEPGVDDTVGTGLPVTPPQSTGETPFTLLKGPSAPAPLASTLSAPLSPEAVLSPLPPSPTPVTKPAPESKALVLYRPINPPLYPGGPPYGSVDLPIALSLNPSVLPRPQALDLSGAPTLVQRRMPRNSSCPQLSSDLPMIEEIDDSTAQQLQVIPWMPNPAAALLANRSPIIEEVEDEAVSALDEEDMMDEEPMEVVTDDVSSPEVTAYRAMQYGNSVPIFGANWQQYEGLQPQLSRAMWSH